MTEKGFFSEDWLQTQQKYWQQWTDMSRQAIGAAGQSPADLTKPWEQALDHWWQAFSPAAPDAGKDFMERMMEQGKVFFRMAESFMPGGGQTVAWADLNKNLEDLKARFTSGLDDGGDALHRMMAFWELPYDNWQRMMSSLSPIPGDVLRNMPHDPVRGHVERMLSAPGLGYTREEQSQYQDLMRRTMDYQQALQEYLGFYAKLGARSVERMQSYMQGVVDSGKPIDSARSIYDNWVRCCEEVYAEEVITPEYAKIHGHLINSQMALKRRMSFIVDESLGALNMPTRSELRTLQDRLQETRRDNKRLKQELNALKRAVAAMTGSAKPAAAKPAAAKTPAASTAPAARTSTKKTPVRKKAAARSTAKD